MMRISLEETDAVAEQKVVKFIGTGNPVKHVVHIKLKNEESVWCKPKR